MELGGALTIFLGLCLSCLVILAAWKRMHKEGKLPPGPTPLPFIGNLLQVSTEETFKSFLAVSRALVGIANLGGTGFGRALGGQVKLKVEGRA